MAEGDLSVDGDQASFLGRAYGARADANAPCSSPEQGWVAGRFGGLPAAAAAKSSLEAKRSAARNSA